MLGLVDPQVVLAITAALGETHQFLEVLLFCYKEAAVKAGRKEALELGLAVPQLERLAPAAGRAVIVLQLLILVAEVVAQVATLETVELADHQEQEQMELVGAAGAAEPQTLDRVTAEVV